MVGVTEGYEVEPGACEETLEEAGPVLHPFEPVPGQRGQLADVALDQVGQGPFEYRPHPFSWFAMVQGSLDEQL